MSRFIKARSSELEGHVLAGRAGGLIDDGTGGQGWFTNPEGGIVGVDVLPVDGAATMVCQELKGWAEFLELADDVLLGSDRGEQLNGEKEDQLDSHRGRHDDGDGLAED